MYDTVQLMLYCVLGTLSEHCSKHKNNSCTCSILIIKSLWFKNVLHHLSPYVLFTVQVIDSCKVEVRLILGVFSFPNVLENYPVSNPKVRVRLKLGCGLI